MTCVGQLPVSEKSLARQRKNFRFVRQTINASNLNGAQRSLRSEMLQPQFASDLPRSTASLQVCVLRPTVSSFVHGNAKSDVWRWLFLGSRGNLS